jgi:hypothetical protein
MNEFARLVIDGERKLKRLRTFRLSRLLKLPIALRIFALLTLFLVTHYVYNATRNNVDAGNVWGLIYGTAALVLMISVAVYGVRRRAVRMAATKKMGKTTIWVQWHIYAGLLCQLMVLMHTGFQLPNGVLNWWLWLFSFWVTAGGLIGYLLQKWIPGVLSSGLSIEVIYERIPDLIRDLRNKSEDLVADCSQPVRDFYRKKIAGTLKRPITRFIYFVDITGGVQKRLKQFGYLKKALSDAEKEKLLQLEAIYKAKLEIDAHYTLQKALRHWMVLHLPASVALLVLVLIHMFAVFYY